MRTKFNSRFLLLAICLGLLFSGCGQRSQPGGGGSTGNYTISGRLIGMTGVTAKNPLAVTQIVAVGTNNAKYLADLSSDGTFSIKVNKGRPYLLGFYNQTGSNITLLGYLKQKDVNWDSLPLMAPSVAETDLGTVEVNAASQEAVPSVDISSLISQMNMDLSTAQFYGSIDDPIVIFSNPDIDGNGIFDFSENKAYLLDIKFNLGPGKDPVTGEVTKMLSGYNDTYRPDLYNYTMMFMAKEGADGASKPPAGTQAISRFPQILTNEDGTSYNQLSGAVMDISQAWGISYESGTYSPMIIRSPAIVPSGSYTFEVSGWGTGSFTFRNVQGSPVVKVGAKEEIVYPVFHLVVDPATDQITRVDYKWMIVKNGLISEATAGEVRAMVQDASPGESVFVETSPAVSFFKSSTPGISYMKKIGLVPGSVDVSDLALTYSDLLYVATGYNLNSNLMTLVFFGK